jgi:nascent polypeptide-associated complex subunit alpha
MSQMMKKLGINVNEIDGVQKIVTNASVSVMKAQGSETWQISGSPTVEMHDVKLVFSDDDVQMVRDATDCDEATARGALEASGGGLAEAIVALSD